MKKLIAIALAALTVLSFSTVAFAADTTTLTTTVPDATYTLNIPADQQITYGETSTDIGTITVTNSSGFATGKNLKVTLTYDKFKSAEVSTTIPYYIATYNDENYENEKQSGHSVIFKGTSWGECYKNYEADCGPYSAVDDNKILQVKIDSTDWGKALGGEYSSTITFTAEVVSES